MGNGLTDEQEKEYRRWQGYANALLIGSTVLFAGTSIIFSKDSVALFVLSTLSGLAAILFTVFWFALELKTKPGGRPLYLMLASIAFGCQVGFLFLALTLNHTRT